jgi:glucose-1-phosphate adenylyltransferase
MLADHVHHGADMTVACVEVDLDKARSFGVMEVDDGMRVVGFEEKPSEPRSMPGQPGHALASMGIYVFNAPFLYEALVRDADDRQSSHDFGKDIIPRVVGRGYRVFAHPFPTSCVNIVEGKPYWRDVGTIDAYWEANMDLISVTPELNLYDANWPIWTLQVQLPPAKFVFDDDDRRGMAVDSMVSGGCVVSGSVVRRSLLSSNVRLHSYCTIEDSVVLPDVEIHRHAVLKRAVVDKYCTLPAGIRIGVDHAEDRKRFHVTDGGITLVTPEMLGQRVHHSR